LYNSNNVSETPQQRTMMFVTAWVLLYFIYFIKLPVVSRSLF